MRLTIRGEYVAERKAIHNRVRAEAGNRCIRCGHGAEGIKRRTACTTHCTHPADGKPRVLTVHHLDGDKANNRWWNTLALCQVCHLTIQGKVIPERPYLWEHSVWFQVYAAGFYAWQQGHDLDRAAIEADLARYLAMGQPWLYEAPK